MGRQINFYINNKIKQAFFKFLNQDGFLFVTSNSFKESDNIFLNCALDEFIVCLYKKKYGMVNSMQIPNNNMLYIDRNNSPVIVFKVPKVDDEKREIFGGRLWLTSEAFTDKNADRKGIERDYLKLVRWIKKNVPYQDCELHGAYASAVVRMYVNDDVAYKLSSQKYSHK